MALFCEAARCVEEGLASPRDIDEVVRSSFGFRLPYFGPSRSPTWRAWMSTSGRRAAPERAGGALSSSRDATSPRREGRLGTASGAGFYDYAPGASETLLVERDRRYASLGALLASEPPLEFEGGTCTE